MTRDLAITDLLITVSLHLPILISVVCRGWVLGPILCGLTHYTHQLVMLNKLWVYVLISVYRVWMVRQPASVRDIVRQKPWVKFCGGVAAASCVILLILEAVSPVDNAFFDPRRLSCYGQNFYGNRALNSLLVLTPFYLTPIIMSLELLIQLLLVVLVQARAARSRDCELLNPKQSRKLILGSIFRLVIVSAHCLPVVSMFADYVIDGKTKNGGNLDPEYHKKVAEGLGLAYVLLPLNCTSPLIYFVVNQQFRIYVSGISEDTLIRAKGAIEKVRRKGFPFQRLAPATATEETQPANLATVTKL